MKRGINPLAVILLIVIAIAGLVIALLVRQHLPASVGGWSGLIFWAVFMAIAGGGGFFIGRKFGRRR